MSLSTTQYGYIVDPMVPFTDDKGKTIKNGFIRVFMAGTSTPVLTYRNYDGATNQEKIELDNSGRVKHNVIGSKGSLYKVVVYDAHHSQETPILTVDKIAVLGASINASGATIVTGLDSVTVQEENFLKATVEGTGVELALDPTEVTSEVSTIGAAETAAPDYVVPLLDKTGTGDSKKISLANLFKFALDWISRLATTVTSFASGDFIAVSNTTNGARKMSKDTLLSLTAQNALAGNVVQAFDPTRDEAHKYLAGEKVMHDGVVKTFKVDHYGVWVDADAETIQMPEFFAQIVDFTNDNFLNSIIKELHFSNLTKAQVKSIDNVIVFNNYSGLYGLVFKAGNTTLSSMTSSSAITTGLLESSLSDGGKAIVDFTFVKDGIHPIVRCTFTEKCLDYNFAPILKRGKWNESWDDFGSGKYLIFGGNATNPSDLNDLKDSGVYVVQRTTATTTANFPSDFPTDGSRATLEIYNNVYDSTRNIVVQILSPVTGYDKWWRIYNSQSDSWVSWTKVSLPAFPSLSPYQGVAEYQVYQNNTTNPSDLNDIVDNSIYVIQRNSDTTTLNFPSDFPADNNRAILSTFKSKIYSAAVVTSVQLLSPITGTDKWWRVYNHSTQVWSGWTKVSVVIPAVDSFIPTSEYQLYGSKATNPADLNSLVDNLVMIVQRTAATTTLHFPSDFPTDASRATLEVFKSKFDASVTTSVQVLTMLTDTYKKWWRVYNHTTKVWNDWVRSDVSDGALEFHVGSGYQYATLRSAVEAANLFQNAKVIIHNGTYDLLVEYADKLNDCFNGNVVGVQLKNGIHILAMDGTKVTANVPDDGTYTDAQLSALGQYFNPFFSNFSNSFTLENLEIEATNTRYCVHDEHGGVGTYVHKYINCKMKFANTISRSGIATYVACIGGGLGEHGTIVVDGGRYESHTVNGASHIGGGDPENHQNCISYHNGNSATCDSSIRITGVYLADRGYIKFGYYGPSTIKSFCEVSGCSLGLPLVIGKEANNDAPVNYDVVGWGNEQKVEGVHWEVGSDGYTQNLVND